MNERIIITLVHWGVVVLVVVATTILSLRGQLDHASTTALFGTVLGHAGTSVTQRLAMSRITDTTPVTGNNADTQ